MFLSSNRSVSAEPESDLQPSAFETLRNALEKHHSKEHLPSELRPQTIVPRRATTSASAGHHNPFTSPPVALSGLPPTHVNSDNPYPTTSQIQESESRGATGSSTQRSSPTIEDTNVSASTLAARRTHDVPGEVWIDPLEREGLPVHAPIHNAGNRGDAGGTLRRRSTWSRGSRDGGAILGEKHVERLAEHQAAGVVRAHTRRGWGWLHRSHKGKKTTRPKVTHEGESGNVDQGHRGTNEKGKATKRTHHHHTQDTENDTDFIDGEPHPAGQGRVRKGVPSGWLTPVVHLPRMHTHRSHPDGPKLGNGVLSTLLALYGHDHEHDDEGSASGASTPGGRSRSSSDAGSEEDILPKPKPPWLSDQDDNHDQSTPKGQKDKRPGKSSLGRSMKGGSASSIIAHLRTPSLPAAPTTAALIAGAGTLSGAAAPQQATLAPNLKRPGYNLVRYSVEEVPKIVARTPNVVPRGLRRAYSTDSGISAADRHSEAESPDTPGGTIVGSPAIASEGLEDRSKAGHDYPISTPGGRGGWTGRLRDLPLPVHFTPSHLRALSPTYPGMEKGLLTPGGSGTVTPRTASAGDTPVDEFGEKKDYFDLKHIEKETQRIKEQERKERKERERHRGKEMRRKRRKAEVYVCRPFSSVSPVDRDFARLRGTWPRFSKDRNSS